MDDYYDSIREAREVLARTGGSTTITWIKGKGMWDEEHFDIPNTRITNEERAIFG